MMNMSDPSTVKQNALFEGGSTIGIYLCIGIVGMAGNGFVIFIFIKSSNMMKRMVNILLMNQSAIDLVASVCLVTISYITSSGASSRFSGVAADLFCRIIGSRLFVWAFATCSTWNLVIINMERYISVSFPVWHKTSLNKRHAIAAIFLSWTFGLLFNFATIFFTSKYSNGKCYVASWWPSKELSILGSVASFMVQFILPIIVMMFCYIGIIKVLRQKNSSWSSKQAM